LEHTPRLHLVKAKKGAVIFPKSGAAIATNNRGILGVDGYVVSHLMVLEAKKDIVIPEWLYWSLCQIDMMEYNGNISYPALQKAVVEKIKIPLPPPKEQKQIVSLLEQQMLAVEKSRIAAEEELQAIRALPAALLRKVLIS
ncbi:MAG: restriction endonuclease subunit S, partial [Gammaproteobacteria bacterium]